MPGIDTIDRPYDWDIPLPVPSPLPILEVYDPETGLWIALA
jgi:hypothetical protein